MLFSYILALVAFILIIVFLEIDNDDPKIFSILTTILLSLAIMYFLNDYPKKIFLFTMEHPMDALMYVGVYFGIGLLWSFIKWLDVLYDLRKKIKKAQENPKSNYSYDRVPDFEQYYDRIISWILYWPFSLFWFCTGRLTKKIAIYIYDGFKFIYKKIYDLMIGSLYPNK